MCLYRISNKKIKNKFQIYFKIFLNSCSLFAFYLIIYNFFLRFTPKNLKSIKTVELEVYNVSSKLLDVFFLIKKLRNISSRLSRID